jgi:hypothetical protein
MREHRFNKPRELRGRSQRIESDANGSVRTPPSYLVAPDVTEGRS